MATYYCPICGHTLDEQRCELKCPVCGYQEDCSDIVLPMDTLRENPSEEDLQAATRNRAARRPGHQPKSSGA